MNHGARGGGGGEGKERDEPRGLVNIIARCARRGGMYVHRVCILRIKRDVESD